jgi:glutamine amidotransferase
MIVIIDHGLGNIKSVHSAVNYLGYKVKSSTSEKDIINSEGLILPGVGNFGAAMKFLQKRELSKILEREVFEKKKKFLGICLGSQLMLSSSEESPGVNGLNWIKGKVKKFPISNKYPTPHVGWNYINLKKKNIKNLPKKFMMYFNHSYYLNLNNKKYVLSRSIYGKKIFDTIYKKENIFGIQPHPEKSQNYGLDFLKYFLDYEC